MSEEATTQNAADIHKKYDRLFRQMMFDMNKELNVLIASECISEVEAVFVVETSTRRTVGNPGIDSLLLTDAYLNLQVRYGG